MTIKDIRYVKKNGEVIEDYPEDIRGHGCIVLGITDSPIHVVCSPKQDCLAIITAYLPGIQEWENNFKIRRKSWNASIVRGK